MTVGLKQSWQDALAVYVERAVEALGIKSVDSGVTFSRYANGLKSTVAVAVAIAQKAKLLAASQETLVNLTTSLEP